MRADVSHGFIQARHDGVSYWNNWAAVPPSPQPQLTAPAGVSITAPRDGSVVLTLA